MREKEVWGRIQPPLSVKGEMSKVEVEALVEVLATGDFEEREAATLELAAFGERVMPMLESFEIQSPEAQRRVLSLPRVWMGLSPFKEFEVMKKFEEDIVRFATDPKGKLWVGIHGIEETVDLGHGFLEASFSPDGSHLSTVNADGTYSLFKVNRP